MSLKGLEILALTQEQIVWIGVPKKGQIRAEFPADWLGIWLGKLESGERSGKWKARLNTDFTEEKCGGGGRI